MIHQVFQSACTIKSVKSAHLKYGIYKSREVEHSNKKVVRKCTRFFIGCSTPYNTFKIVVVLEKQINSISVSMAKHTSYITSSESDLN